MIKSGETKMGGNIDRNTMLNCIYYALGFDRVCSFKAYLIQSACDSDYLVRNLYYQITRGCRNEKTYKIRKC